ncbi:MAG TPA: MFS transporter [Chloroflexota bacterium]|nr:MFS transporter [Chloroflexota bacterium]
MRNPASGPVSAVAGAPASFRVLLSNRNFTFLWAAQLLSQIAQNIINFAVLVKVEKLSHSTTQIAVTIVSFTLPAVLFGPIAGVFVDRIDKKAILVYTNVLRAVATLGFVFLDQSLPAIYALLFISSAINQLFGPAEGSSIPMLVKRDQLLNAMSLFNVTFYSAVAIGFVMIAPAAIKLAGLNVAFYITAAMYVAAAGLCQVLPRRMGLRQVPPPKRTEGWQIESRTQFWDDLREGLLHILANGELLAAIVQLTLISTLLLIMGEIAPGFTHRVLNLTAEDTAFVFLPMGAGLLAGMVTTGRITTLVPKQLLTRMAVAAIGLLMFGVGISPPLSHIGNRITESVGFRPQAANWLIGLDLFLFLLLGLAFAYVLVPAQTLVQELAGDEVRGRVLSIQLMASSAFMIVPLLFVGGLADAFGITSVLMGMGLLIALPSAYGLRNWLVGHQTGRERASA